MALTQASEEGLKISNAGTNGQYLQKQSGNTGGLTWADVPAGVGGATGVDFNDNVKIRSGTGNDLEIYHNGTDSFIDSNTGKLRVLSDQFRFNNAANDETLIHADANGAVSLYYNNIKSLTTNSTGVEVLGAEGASGVIGLSADEADDNADIWRMRANTDGTFDLQNYASGSYETTIKATGNAGVELYYDNVKRIETKSWGAYVFGDLNVSGGDLLINSADSLKIKMGAGNDLEIYHDGTNSHIDNNTGELRLNSASAIKLYHNDTILYYTESDRLRCGDNISLDFGNVSDLRIYHDASNSYLTNGTGNLYITNDGGGTINLQTNGSENAVKCIEDGAVELYHNGVKKLWTESWGVSIDGNFALGDNEKLVCGGSDDFQIYHDGSNSYIHDAGDGVIYVRTNNFQVNNTANNETMIYALSNGSVQLYYDNSKKFETTSDGVETNSSFQGITSPGVIHAKTGGGANNQVFVACTYNGTTFGGGLRRNGTAQGVELFDASDRRIKKNIAPMPAVLSKLNQIELKTYGYKNDDTASGLGPIAQDIANIFPEKVAKTDDGTGDDLPSDVKPWTVGNDFTWHLIKAVQELSAKIETLETKVAALEAA